MAFGNSIEKINDLAKKNKSTKIIPYTKSKDKNVRLAAIRGLGVSGGGEEAFNKLTSYLSSTDAQERAAAAEALGNLGRSQASSFISYHLDRETDSVVSQAMRSAMVKLRQSN